MCELKNYVYQTPRTLPVILLLDTSGSMENNNKIGILNVSVREMLRNFKEFYSTTAGISVAIITFGGSKAKLHLPLTAVEELDLDALQDMGADGMTPMGDALDMAKAMIEDRAQIPSRAYRPTVVLVSDGMPNDQWEEPLERFQQEGRSAKCCRMAMGIGVERCSEAREILERFTDDREQVFEAADAAEIGRFFRYVTMSTASRISSVSPNELPRPSEILQQPEVDPDDDDDDICF